jgi:hypothetical protein
MAHDDHVKHHNEIIHVNANSTDGNTHCWQYYLQTMYKIGGKNSMPAIWYLMKEVKYCRKEQSWLNASTQFTHILSNNILIAYACHLASRGESKSGQLL